MQKPVSKTHYSPLLSRILLLLPFFSISHTDANAKIISKIKETRRMATLPSFASNERRPSGTVVSALFFHAGGPGFEPRWDPANFFTLFCLYLSGLQSLNSRTHRCTYTMLNFSDTRARKILLRPRLFRIIV